MNKGKLIKKLLRNQKNRVLVELLETDPWGGDRIINEFATFGALQQESLRWKHQLREYYGPSVDFMMDVPSLVYRLSIVGQDEVTIHRETFHDLQSIKEFLIGGFDGILPDITDELDQK